MEPTLQINNLHVSIKDLTILNGINLTLPTGETHVIMGQNGSGKSTLATTLAGHPAYSITQGSISFNGEDLAKLAIHERAQKGLFLAFQYPLEIEGVSLREFLYQAYQAKQKALKKNANVAEFETLLITQLKNLKMKPAFVERQLNVGFSGGEKKQAEILQLAILQPKLAILDEIDSGLDVDALKKVCACINAIKETNTSLTLLIITHYPRILHYLTPDVVHIMDKGKMVKSGTKDLAHEIEAEGYTKFL